MKASTLEGAAFCLILGLCVCADGLADMPGGMAALWGGVALSGALVCLAHSLPRSGHRAAQRPAEGKRKAAAVVATPQRQVKQTRKTSISVPILPGRREIVKLNFKMMDALLLASNGYTGTIDADMLHLKGAKNSTDHFYAELAKTGLTSEKMPDELHDALATVETEYERQGFISGFRMGAKLMLECIGPAPLEAWDPNEVGNPVSRVR